jgi:hypothetical protein
LFGNGGKIVSDVLGLSRDIQNLIVGRLSNPACHPAARALMVSHVWHAIRHISDEDEPSPLVTSA